MLKEVPGIQQRTWYWIPFRRGLIVITLKRSLILHRV